MKVTAILILLSDWNLGRKFHCSVPESDTVQTQTEEGDAGFLVDHLQAICQPEMPHTSRVPQKSISIMSISLYFWSIFPI